MLEPYLLDRPRRPLSTGTPAIGCPQGRNGVVTRWRRTDIFASEPFVGGVGIIMWLWVAGLTVAAAIVVGYALWRGVRRLLNRHAFRPAAPEPQQRGADPL